jgi:hypothetical protein
MGITETRSPWSSNRTGFSDQNPIGRSPQSSPRNDCGHVGKQGAIRRDGPTVEPPRDGNRVIEPVRDKR